MGIIDQYIPMLIFIPLIPGSIIGLSFALMLLTRLMPMPSDKPELLNRVYRTLASGNREKAILLLEEDNHPISCILSFTMRNSATSLDDLKGTLDYGSLNMEKRLTSGTKTFAWLTLWIPVFTILMYFVIPEKPSGNLLNVLVLAILGKVIFWNLTLMLSKLKVRAIIDRAEESFKLLCGFMMEDEILSEGLQDIVDKTEDSVEISSDIEQISKGVREKAGNQD